MADYSYSVEDVLKQLAMLLGLVYFVCVMLFDAFVAIWGKPARIWNPGKSLLINALTIQLLSFLKVKIIKFSDDETDSLKGYFKVRQDIRQNRLVGESGRVVTCVLIGYLLPGMARAGSATDWRALAALGLSLFTFEFYYLTTLFYNPPPVADELSHGREFLIAPSVINIVTMVSIILVVLFSICAILAGKTIRGTLAQRISVIQRDNRKRSEEGPWQKFEGEIVESWFLSRVCHPKYVIARSVLSSAVGLIVTICILFSVIPKVFVYTYNFDDWWGAYDIIIVAFTLELAFIIIGGTIIFCRWFMAVVYFPRFFVTKMKLISMCRRPFIEDFWTRSILELVQIYDLQVQSKGLVLRLATTLKMHYLFYLLLPLQVSLIYFSKGCLFISQLLFSFKFVWFCLSSQSLGEFEQYREILEKVCMPGQNPQRLWMANKKSLKQAKDLFKGKKEKAGSECKDLINFIKPRFHLDTHDDERFVTRLKRLSIVADHFPNLDENCTRMTAVSLLNVIIELLPLHRDVGKVNKAVEAYKEALDLMSFVDYPDPQNPATLDVLKVIDIEADRVSVAVHNEFQRLLKLHKDKINSLEKSSAPTEIHDWALKAINQLLNDAEKRLKIINKEEQMGSVKQTTGEDQTVNEGQNDSRDWSAIVASYNTYRVCSLILREGLNSENEIKMEYLYDSLADVLGYCLLKLYNVMVKTCREWAIKFEEEKIWDAICLAGKANGVMQGWDVEEEKIWDAICLAGKATGVMQGWNVEEEKIWDAICLAGKATGVMQGWNVEDKGGILERKFSTEHPMKSKRYFTDFLSVLLENMYTAFLFV